VETPPTNGGSQPALAPDAEYIAGVRKEIQADTAYFNKQMTRHRLGRIITIVAATMVPVLATATPVPRWVLGLLGAIAAVTEGIQELFQFKRSALNAMRKGNELERILNKYMTATGRYRDSRIAFQHLAEDIEMIRKAADDAFLQTWQATSPAPPAVENHPREAIPRNRHELDPG
jgi:hypothetical protein